jgi:hypothetical protein
MSIWTKRSRYVIAACCLLGVIAASGCSVPSMRGAGQGSDNVVAKTWTGMTRPVRQSWRSVTKSRGQSKLPNWDWATGIPEGAPRAELIAAELPQSVVATLFPNDPAVTIQLASAYGNGQGMRICNIGGHQVQNCADMYAALEGLEEKEKKQFDLRGSDGREIALKAQSNELHALASATAGQSPLLRATNQGNPCIILREPGITAKVVTRVERSRGILHLILSHRKLDGGEATLPREIQANCGGNALQCLTVSETLRLLYRSDQPLEKLPPVDPKCQFSTVAGRSDYLIPTAFQQLSDQFESDEVEAENRSLVPAFAAVSGNAYPGSPILGDARALTGFMLQPQVASPNDGEKTGWVVFAGESLKGGGVVTIHLDLGHGMKEFSFLIPSP